MTYAEESARVTAMTDSQLEAHWLYLELSPDASTDALYCAYDEMSERGLLPYLGRSEGGPQRACEV